MNNMEPMQLAWLAYLVGSVLLVALFWWASANWRPALLGRLLRAWVAILLLVPAYADADNSYLAPAWAVTFFVTAGEGLEAASGAYWPLLTALVLATTLIVAGAIVRWSRSRVAAGQKPVSTARASSL